jgi:hypothetical protein
MPNLKDVPPIVKHALDAWAESAQPPGQFCIAVLENKLQEAYARADDACLANMHAIVLYVYNELPSGCWGDPEKVKAWRGQSVNRPSHTGAAAR